MTALERNARWRAKVKADPVKHEEQKAKNRARWARTDKSAKNTKARERYANDPDFRKRGRGHQLAYFYGLSMDEFESMVARQSNRCALCGDRFSATPCVDHHHDASLGQYVGGKWKWFTGVSPEQKRSTVRWLACDPCNRAIALMDEDPRVLRRAAKCLEIWFRQGLTLRDARAGQLPMFGAQ